VPRDEHEAVPVLREPAELAAVVRALVNAIAVLREETAQLSQQLRAALHDRRNVLEDDQLRRLISERLEREPQPLEDEAVERLIFRLGSALRREEPRVALARRRAEDDVWKLAVACGE